MSKVSKKQRTEFDRRFPVMRFTTGLYFDSFESVWKNDVRKYSLPESEIHDLEQISEGLSEELTTLSIGLESIGYLLAVAADNERAGIHSPELQSLGWYLHHMGAQIDEYSNAIEKTNDILAKPTISKEV